MRFCILYRQNKNKIILVKYEDFIIDKKKYIEDLALDLDFTIQTDISNYVNIQYQPKGNAEIDLKEFFGSERLISLSREISKIYEETYRGSISDAITYLADKNPKGEFVICIDKVK